MLDWQGGTTVAKVPGGQLVTKVTIWGVVVNQNNFQNKFGKNWKSNLLPAKRLGGAIGPSANWIRTGGGGGGG